MGLIDLSYEEGQTPLDEVEQRNIEEAILWTIQRRRKFTAQEILTEQFIKDLHRRMFGSVWKWADSFRHTNKNIGVDKYQTGIELKMLLDDCRYWIDQATFSPDEIAIRFKHRLMAIHCFSNGNGRHSRLMADVIIGKLFGNQLFSWNGQNLINSGTSRSAYLTAIREADKGYYKLLLEFARS